MSYDQSYVKIWFGKFAEKARENVDLLARLDGLSGDGDLGETIGKIAAVLEKERIEEHATIAEMVRRTATEMNKAAPSTLGTLLSVGTMAVAKACKGKEELEDSDLARLPAVFAEAIKEKGRAEPGDKTILDSLCPMAEKVQKVFEEKADLKRAFAEGAKAAADGAEKTRGMVPKAGRAQWIGERVKDNLDGGAVLCAKLSELFMDNSSQT